MGRLSRATCVLIRECGGVGAVLGNELTMRGRTEAVVWFLNFALAVEMDMRGEESLMWAHDVGRGGGSLLLLLILPVTRRNVGYLTCWTMQKENLAPEFREVIGML